MSSKVTIKDVLDSGWDEPRRRAERNEKLRRAGEEAQSMEALRLLLETEKQADAYFEKAEAWRRELPGRVTAAKAEIQERIRGEYEQLMARDDAAETARADAIIAERRAEYERRREQLVGRFSESREEYAEKLFALVTGESDE